MAEEPASPTTQIVIGIIAIIASIGIYPVVDSMLAPSTLDVPSEYRGRTTGRVKEFTSVPGTAYFKGGGSAPSSIQVAIVTYRVDGKDYEGYGRLGDTVGIGTKVGVAYKPESPQETRCYLIHTVPKFALAIVCVICGLIGLGAVAYGTNRIIRARTA